MAWIRSKEDSGKDALGYAMEVLFTMQRKEVLTREQKREFEGLLTGDSLGSLELLLTKFDMASMYDTPQEFFDEELDSYF